MILGRCRLSLLKLRGAQSQRRKRKRDKAKARRPLFRPNKGLLVPHVRLWALVQLCVSPASLDGGHRAQILFERITLGLLFNWGIYF